MPIDFSFLLSCSRSTPLKPKLFAFVLSMSKHFHGLVSHPWRPWHQGLTSTAAYPVVHASPQRRAFPRLCATSDEALQPFNQLKLPFFMRMVQLQPIS
ncbi:hypothetical protein COLO4_08108 [Corchorus olitorius]|uniref:Uncharacterized protein n=1 Tax=Corchorus olitorius TaxID=93759 RepID=A0A1R3KHA8_9ROSI|nr:hypothetical protein COLO4_08108 [Corchorus olitorius]